MASEIPLIYSARLVKKCATSPVFSVKKADEPCRQRLFTSSRMSYRIDQPITTSSFCRKWQSSVARPLITLNNALASSAANRRVWSHYAQREQRRYRIGSTVAQVFRPACAGREGSAGLQTCVRGWKVAQVFRPACGGTKVPRYVPGYSQISNATRIGCRSFRPSTAPAAPRDRSPARADTPAKSFWRSRDCRAGWHRAQRSSRSCPVRSSPSR